MTDTGFTKIQLKQLQGLFDKNNDQTNDAIYHVVDSLSSTIQDVKIELNEKIDSLRREIKDDIQNLTTTMATKYEVQELRKKVVDSSVVFRTT